MRRVVAELENLLPFIVGFLIVKFLYVASGTEQPFMIKAGAKLERILGQEDKTRPPRCTNRVSWTLYKDRFSLGSRDLCDSCFFAAFDPKIHAAVPIEKPAFFRPTCSVRHRAHYEDVVDKMIAKCRQKFRDDLEIQVRTIMPRADAAIVRLKAQHVGETLSDFLSESASNWQVEAIMFRDDTYFVRLVRGRKQSIMRIQRELVDDVLDSSKPRPESRAKFEGRLQQITTEVKGLEGE